MQSKTIQRLLSGLFLLGLYGCARLHDGVMPAFEQEPIYDQFYPFYVEVCAVSQIRANFAEHGGSPGHAVMYLKGACRDPESPYPRLELCDPSKVDLSDPESGVGVSVNKIFKNVNWMAIPGKRFFYHGDLGRYERLDADRAIATIYEADKRGIFDGIEIHGEYMPPEDDEDELLYLGAAQTLATDFALNFGRTIWCAKLPVTREMMGDIIGFLNDLNDEYASDKATYNWSGYADNCSHLIRNSLAAADVWKPKSINTIKFRQLFNLSVPANEFADLAIRANDFPLDDFHAIYTDRTMRRSLMERGWIPTQHGAMVQAIPVHQNNEIYDTKVRIFVLEAPVLRPKSRKVDRFLIDARFTNLEANLRYYRDRYQAILDERPPLWDKASPGDAYAETRRRYYQYIEEQLADVNEKLDRLYARAKGQGGILRSAGRPFVSVR